MSAYGLTEAIKGGENATHHVLNDAVLHAWKCCFQIFGKSITVRSIIYRMAKGTVLSLRISAYGCARSRTGGVVFGPTNTVRKQAFVFDALFLARAKRPQVVQAVGFKCTVVGSLEPR